jgi:hypothetical protein
MEFFIYARISQPHIIVEVTPLGHELEELEGRTCLTVLRINVDQDMLRISVNLIHKPNLLASLVHVLLINAQ